MKRGAHTSYEYEQTLIYEFKNRFYVIQQGQQGVSLNPAHGSEQRPAEVVKLLVSLPIACDDAELGSAVVEALDAFDIEGPDFEPWENKKSAAHIKSWLGARGQKDIDTNSRLVSVGRSKKSGGAYGITPFDNCNTNPWLGPIEGKVVTVSANAAIAEIGASVRRAFDVATHHPTFAGQK